MGKTVQVFYEGRVQGVGFRYTARRVADMIFDLNRDAGTALVLVTHDNELASRCSQVVRLRNGQRVES